MPEIEDLKRLDPILTATIEREVAKRHLRPGDGRDVLTEVGFSRAAMVRGALHFRQNISSDDADVDGAGTAFATAWMIAERETFRRVAAAISTPAARGREVDVVAALAKGASVEDALRVTEGSDRITSEPNVITLHPQRVTASSE